MSSQAALSNSASFQQDSALVARYAAARGRTLSISSESDTPIAEEETVHGNGSGVATPRVMDCAPTSKVKPKFFEGRAEEEQYVPATERDPLLPRRTSVDRYRGREEAVEGANQNKPWTWWDELKVLTSYVLPVFGTHLLEYSLNVASVISIGHISTVALAACSLGNMTAGVTGLSIVQGFASALDTLLPSAWTSGNPQLVGLWFQRMLILVTALLFPIIALWFNAERLLLALKQDPEVARLAALYLKWLSLEMPAYAFNNVLRRYFQAQGLFSVPTKIIMIAAPLNAFLNYLLVWGPEPIRLGFIGAPIATGISSILITISYIIYGVFIAPKTAWHPWTTKAFEELGLLIKLGFSGVLQIAAEWWSWELVALATSQLGPIALATQSVLLVSSSTSYQAPYALSVATSVRIGNLLGARESRIAKISCHVSLGMTLFIASILSAIFLIFKNNWAYLFNSDPAVVKLTAYVMPLVALFQVFDGLGSVTGGILRAKGQQTIGAALNFVGYYIIGIPIGLLLAFHANMGIFGLWTGLTIALVVVAGSGVWICLATNWEKEVEKAIARLGLDSSDEQTAV